jgi:hypothetical protein
MEATSDYWRPFCYLLEAVPLEDHDRLIAEIAQLTARIETVIAAIDSLGRQDQDLPQGRYRRITEHAPREKSVVAVARNILKIIRAR